MSLNTLPCNPYPISTEELNKGNNDDLNTRVSALETAVEEIDNDKADLGVIAAEFDAEAGVYAVGDLVMYQGKLYEFTTAHETAGDWDSTEVTEKTVSDEIDTVKSGLTNKLGYIRVDVGGTEINNQENGWYYANINLSTLPSGAVPISVYFDGGWDVDVFYTININTVIARCLTSKTIGTNNRYIRVLYYIP